MSYLSHGITANKINTLKKDNSDNDNKKMPLAWFSERGSHICICIFGPFHSYAFLNSFFIIIINPLSQFENSIFRTCQ